MPVKKEQKIKSKDTIVCCRFSIEKHPKCDRCGLLVGPGHEEKTLYPFEGKGLCRGCHPDKSLRERRDDDF
jgi:hypothetical protein